MSTRSVGTTTSHTEKPWAAARFRLEEVTRMPQREHLPSVSDKEQRMYEHVKQSELEQGRPAKRAKAIAAATVVKHHNDKGHPKSK